MLYKRLIIDGEELCLAVCQSGNGAPTESTMGCVGIFYTDDNTGAVYKCISEEDGCCQWELMPCLQDIAGLQKQIADLKADFEYEPIKITSFSVSPTKVEMGGELEKATFKWAINKTPAKLTLNGAKTDPGGSPLTMAFEPSITGNKTWTLIATDERAATASLSASVTFLNGVYYGAAALPDVIDSAFIQTLTKELSSTKKRTFTITVGAEKYFWYAVPTRLGECSFKVGGFAGGVPLVSTLLFENASGYAENYYVYRSANPGFGTKDVEVS